LTQKERAEALQGNEVKKQLQKNAMRRNRRKTTKGLLPRGGEKKILLPHAALWGSVPFMDGVVQSKWRPTEEKKISANATCNYPDRAQYQGMEIIYGKPGKRSSLTGRTGKKGFLQ